jgi:hypothetical protein
LNIGRSVTFKAAGRSWTIQPFSLDAWFGFCDWLKSRPKTHDPLERVSKLPLEKLSPDVAERLVMEAIAEDKALYDFRPDSDATKAALSSVDGVIKVISLLSNEDEGEVRNMVMTLAREGKMDVLSNAISQSIGAIEKKAGPAVEA